MLLELSSHITSKVDVPYSLKRIKLLINSIDIKKEKHLVEGNLQNIISIVFHGP